MTKRKKILFSAIFLIISFIPITNLFAEDPAIKFEHFTPDTGLSANFINFIFQDKKGFIWIGTSDGLNKYDGYTFTVFRHDAENPHSLINNSVNAVWEDKNGRLWLGTQGGLNMLDPETERFERYIPDKKIAYNPIWSVYGDSSEKVWIAARTGGLYEFDHKNKTFVNYQHSPDDPKSLSSNHAEVVFEDSLKNLWIGTSRGLNLFDRKTGTFDSFQHDPSDSQSLSHNMVRDIYEDSRGFLWICTDRGLNRFAISETKEYEHIKFEKFLHDENNPDSLSHNAVRFVREDSQGVLWIGTYGGGVNKLIISKTGENPKAIFKHYTHSPNDPQSLIEDGIMAFFEDNSGSFWFGTSNGISKTDFRKNKFPHYKYNPDTPLSIGSNKINQIYEDSKGYIWFCLTGGGLDRFNPETGNYRHYLPDKNNPDSLSLIHTISICEENAGFFWVGTWGGGLERFDSEKEIFSHYKHDPANPDTISSNLVTFVKKDRKNNLWVGTWEGGLNRFNRETNTFTRFLHDPYNPDSLVDNRVLYIFQDKTGVLWICAVGGLDRFEPETQKFVHFQHNPDNPDSLGHATVLMMHEDQNNNLWIGTEGGLDRFDRETEIFHHYTIKHGLANNSVKGVVEDDRGNLWISTNKGLSCLIPDFQRIKKGVFRNYDKEDGLQGAAFRLKASCKTKTGELYFGGNNGFNRFHPKNIKDNPHIPPVILTDFQLFNKSVPIAKNSVLQKHITYTKRIILSHDLSKLGFEFSALNYISPLKNKYAYMLEGFDKDWIYTDSRRRFARYTNLDPGKYIFHVKGSNNDNVWNNKETSLEVIILPPWWTSWLFRGFMLTSIILAMFSAYSWRIKSLQNRKTELEQEVMERTTRLQKSEQRFAAVMNSMESIIYVADMDTYEILFINHYTRKLFGDIEGQICWQALQKGQTGPCAFCTNKYLVLNGRPTGLYTWDFQNTITGMWYHNHDQAIQWLNGHLVRLEIATDITELKQIEEYLRLSEKAADAANQAKSAFIANMSHELRTPMNAILGFSRLISHDKTLNPEHREHLSIIRRSGKHLLSLINDVLDMSKIEAGRTTVNENIFNLYDLLDDLKDMLGLRAEKKDLSLIVTYGPDIPQFIKTDEIKLRQVLINLIGNAVKFTQQGEIQLSVNSEKKITDYWLVFTVKDTGPGIEPDEMETLFKAFAQTKTGIQTQEGTGLGLSISQKFVQLMGGEIKVRSEVDKGTTFFFEIQIHLADAEEIESKTRTQKAISIKPGQPGYKILIVDDNNDNRNLLIKILEPFGFELYKASNGQIAVEIWQKHLPNLIWMDMRMPVMDGYEAVKTIRDMEKNNPKGTETIIIAQTASVLEEERTIIIEAGCNDFLRKPFRDSEIFELMHRHLNVQLVYEDADIKKYHENRPKTISSEDLSGIPDNILKRLKQAAINVDMEKTDEIINELCEINTDLANNLSELAADFEYGKIIKLITPSS
ncbi:two-component regulator propeller domain-containing protein [Desulfobacterales bacterium HSG17]|nr:two-component regulator propeller domain-containing protein [Desulfobacterales bacterium HSG17]